MHGKARAINVRILCQVLDVVCGECMAQSMDVRLARVSFWPRAGACSHVPASSCARSCKRLYASERLRVHVFGASKSVSESVTVHTFRSDKSGTCWLMLAT